MAEEKSFWKSTPGISAIAALLTAVGTVTAVMVDVFRSGDGSPPTATPTVAVSTTVAAGYKLVVHPLGAFSMEVPADWEAGPSQIKDLRNGERAGPALLAASNLSLFGTGWTEPGAVLGASNSLAIEFDLARTSPEVGLDRISNYLRSADWTLQGCVFEGESAFEREPYVGLYRRWRNCGQIGAFFWELIAMPSNGSFVVHVQIQFHEPSETAVADRILEIFEVKGDRLPANP